MLRFLLLFSLLGMLGCDDSSQETNDIPTTDSVSLDKTTHPTIRQINEQLKNDPKNSYLYYARSEINYQLDNLPEALRDIRYALSLDSLNPEYYSLMADIYFDGQKIERSIDAMERSIILNNKDVNALLKLAKYKLYVKEYDESIRLINSALKIDIYNPFAYFLKGMNYRELGNTSKAISSWQTAVEQDPSYTEAYMQMGLAYSKEGDSLGVAYFDNILKLDSTHIQAAYAKAKFFQDTEQFQRAIQTYKKLLAVDPQNEEVFYNLGVIYYGLDSIQKAYNNFNFATKANPTYAEAYAGLGLCSELMGNKEKALEYYKAALKFNPDNKLAQESLNRINS